MRYKNHADGKVILKKDYAKKIIFSLEDFAEKGHLLQKITIPPYTKQRLHRHFLQTEVYFILSGEASIFINGEKFLATPEDAFIASPKDTHQLWNTSDKDFTLVVFKINLPTDSEDTQWFEE